MSLNTLFTVIGICHTSYVDCMLATNCFEYSIETPDDGQYICPQHVELFTKIK